MVRRPEPRSDTAPSFGHQRNETAFCALPHRQNRSARQRQPAQKNGGGSETMDRANCQEINRWPLRKTMATQNYRTVVAASITMVSITTSSSAIWCPYELLPYTRHRRIRASYVGCLLPRRAFLSSAAHFSDNPTCRKIPVHYHTHTQVYMVGICDRGFFIAEIIHRIWRMCTYMSVFRIADRLRRNEGRP